MTDNQKKLKDAFEKFEHLDKKQIQSQLDFVFNAWINCIKSEKTLSDSSLKYLCEIALKSNISGKLYLWLKSLTSEKQQNFIASITKYDISDNHYIVLQLEFGLLGFYLTEKNPDFEILKLLLNETNSELKSKKDEYKYFLNYFINSLQFNDTNSYEISFVNFNSIGLQYYAAKSLLKKFQQLVFNVDENYKKLKNDEIRKLFLFTVWLDKSALYLVQPQRKDNKPEKSEDSTREDLINHINELNNEAEILKENKKQNVNTINDLRIKFNAKKKQLEDSENSNEQLKADNKKLENEIKKLNESINQKDKEIAEHKNMNNVITSVEEHKTDETFKKIASRLKIEYEEFNEAKNIPMTAELGEITKELLKNVFEKLKNFGIKME